MIDASHFSKDLKNISAKATTLSGEETAFVIPELEPEELIPQHQKQSDALSAPTTTPVWIDAAPEDKYRTLFRGPLAANDALALKLPDHTSVTTVLTGLNDSPDIQALLFQNSSLGDSDIATIANTLKSNSSVKHLILSNNHITNQGANAIAEMLAANRIIGWLVLDKNKIEGAGAKTIAQSLQTHPGVKHVILSGNPIGNDGTTALAAILPTNHTVESFFLRNTNTSDAGAIALLNEIKKGTSLSILDLRDNPISPEIKAKLQSACKDAGIRVYS